MTMLRYNNAFRVILHIFAGVRSATSNNINAILVSSSVTSPRGAPESYKGDLQETLTRTKNHRLPCIRIEQRDRQLPAKPGIHQSQTGQHTLSCKRRAKVK
jgi:hypothetical protein